MIGADSRTVFSRPLRAIGLASRCRLRSVVLAVAVVAAWSQPAPARQDDQRLVGLFEGLREAATEAEAGPIEREIWDVWMQSGRAEVDDLMAQGVEAMSARAFARALEAFDRIVQLDPGFAEGWNKRATVHWLMDHNAQSVVDIRRTLALEPRHFGAISGMGLILMEEGDAAGALKAFEAVLEINPNARGAKRNIEQLRALIKDDSV